MGEEPKFALRAQDKFMPAVLEFWADKVEAATRDTVSGQADRSREKVKQARALAHSVRAWQILNRCKIPD